MGYSFSYYVEDCIYIETNSRFTSQKMAILEVKKDMDE
jgi:hypothetical protein